jgi:hypothetical protein
MLISWMEHPSSLAHELRLFLEHFVRCYSPITFSIISGHGEFFDLHLQGVG